ncbi:STAS domain-containing protein [Vibrio sp. 99-70-13A1]|uniref:STAS domain-containing protein n=1 Tax=Vibrio sp. 99-70-13A1 TaxID=2607601 RepID=UPI001493993E|nr:STAS domain-containing protein [Vibrio sp. 99-70-13A1]NOH95211.1 STAS domain-containing protein [Vibrio sp. 99-70-13A1]
MPKKHAYFLPDEFTIYEASEVYGDICDHLNTHGHCQIDGSRVEEVDTAGIQILCKFLHDKSLHHVSLVDPSDRLRSAFSLLGLESMSTRNYD